MGRRPLNQASAKRPRVRYLELNQLKPQQAGRGGGGGGGRGGGGQGQPLHRAVFNTSCGAAGAVVGQHSPLSGVWRLASGVWRLVRHVR
jgi:hypothetical protein